MWKDTILQALDDRHLFQSDDHRSRFKELLDCYADASFFTPGLCKCMFMSCWDEEHFFIMLDMLNQLSLKRHMGLNDMCENGELSVEVRLQNTFNLECNCDLIYAQRSYYTENNIVTDAGFLSCFNSLDEKSLTRENVDGVQLELINPANRDGLLRKIKHETEIKTHVRLQPGQRPGPGSGPPPVLRRLRPRPGLRPGPPQQPQPGL